MHFFFFGWFLIFLKFSNETDEYYAVSQKNNIKLTATPKKHLAFIMVLIIIIVQNAALVLSYLACILSGYLNFHS